MGARQQARRAERTAKQAADSGPIKTLGRVGLVAYGVVHLLVAYLAVRVALGGGGRADKTGALQAIAEQPAGRFLLWVLAVGLAALTLWQLAEAGWGHQDRRPQRRRSLQRLVSLGEAAVAGALAFSAFKVASGKGAKSKGEKAAFVDKVFDWPAGQLLVAVVGLGIVAVALYLVHRGMTRRFVEDLDLAGAEPHARDAAIRFGQVGWTALGVAYGIIGLLIVYSAVTYDAKKATGMDTALKTLAGQAYGTALLLIVAAGLACFGLYCLFDARYRRG
jgi:sulfite exporter TauE/SafE